MISRKSGLCLTALASVCAVSGGAWAGGFYIQEQSAAGVGRAQAGNVAIADDASTIYFNPAGMTELEGVQVTSGIDLIVPTASLTDNGSTTRSFGSFLVNPSSGGYALANGNNGGNPGSATAIPDFYVSAQIPDLPITVGLGVTSPFGFASKFAEGSFARYDSIDSFVETFDIAPTVAWKVTDWLSIGAGLDEQYAYVKLRSALPDPLSLGGPTPATDGRLTLTGHEWATGYNVGLLLKPAPGTKIGFSYRSAITHNVDGAVTFAGLTGPLALLNGQVGANAALDLPDIFSGGVAQQITPELTLLGEVDYFTWSDFKSITINLASGGSLITPENYRDTFSGAIGAEYQLTDQIKLRTGFKYDQTPTVDAYRDTRVPDGDRYWLSGGIHYALSDRLGLDASYAHIFLDDSVVHVTRSFYGAALPIPTTASINATSSVALDLLTVGFSYRF
jgi:long-chain fatty acid transport protein